VTFVPDNYEDLVLPLAEDPHVEGLLILDNRSPDVVLKALLLSISMAGPRMGFQLLKNFFKSSALRKKSHYEKAHKKVLIFKDINSPDCIQALAAIKPDLILNARTRSFFRKDILNLPRLGCINIHHGLLPDQRGLMCDLWAHLENTPAGFSIHVMTPKLDDGAILNVTEVPSNKKNYLASLKTGARLEAQVTSQLLANIQAAGKIEGQNNIKTEKTVYRRNPGIKDFYKLRLRGVKI
jgi:folate-dependent phosphoribosylglycinamide formyltransferase PurN